MTCRPFSLRSLLGIAAGLSVVSHADSGQLDFNRDVRPILSQNCFLCHGPDENERKGNLRLDVRDEALKSGRSGNPAIVPGDSAASEIVKRVKHSDPDEQMPPAKSNKHLTPEEIGTLVRWVEQGAPYAVHWAYAKPNRPPRPAVSEASWPRNGVDHFVLERLDREGLKPSPQAGKRTLVRRLYLDLVGLPPTPAQVSHFLQDTSPDAYERLVDRLLGETSFGEHWATMWLDLARYADSSGYADDPLRSIWGYRDYVIKSFNDNKPFDQFTIEQIAGDLIENPTEEQLIATAFHRNTMTNNEGGTSDEEFRNAAVVDRANTTMTVWMGTSMACAQCHTHKYDPITQEEYFKFMAFLDNTEDADRSDESPTLSFFTPPQKEERTELEAKLALIEPAFTSPSAEALQSYSEWTAEFPRNPEWHPIKPSKVSTHQDRPVTITAEGVVEVGASESLRYDVETPLETSHLSAIFLHFPRVSSESNRFAISRITARLLPPADQKVSGRYLRIELPGKDKILSLAEVKVLSGGDNIALQGSARQSTTAFGGDAKLAIDGITEGTFDKGSTTHTETSEDPWWEVDLAATRAIDQIEVWNRTDNSLQKRLNGFRISLLDENRAVLWEQEVTEAPQTSLELAVDGSRPVPLAGVWATSTAEGSDVGAILRDRADKKKNWSPGAEAEASVTLLLSERLEVAENARLLLSFHQPIEAGRSHVESFRLEVADESAFPQFATLPPPVLRSLSLLSDLSETDRSELQDYYLRQVAPELASERKAWTALKNEIDAIKPATVPIMRELAGEKRRVTHLQYRGSYSDLGDPVTPGVPSAFHPLPSESEPSRLALARWLVAPENPLTARVIANRFWEQIFGIGLVQTSEEFGSQGEPPSHPELLDWLATELVAQGWDMKKFIRMLVTSATYRQSARVTPEAFERDPENRLLARGPRFRMGAETVRDQALFVAGLLSSKMYGPSVKPPRPASGLKAAFGSSVDWQTSEGEDRFRRALYTETRRTSPYPSTASFDAPNREVCTVRRNRTNTPLQALVTLNDPVYVEAAQALARRMAHAANSLEDRLRLGFEACLARTPSEREFQRLRQLYDEAQEDLAGSPSEAALLAGSESTDLAALTAVANVLLNLDELLMKR